MHVVRPKDILGRDEVTLDLSRMTDYYTNRVVMVTGAGGSIGSELCRQILHARPAKLILFEMSEFALYTIDRELKAHSMTPEIEVVPLLGSVCDAKRVNGAMKTHGVNVVLHAAAYKHVPLAEANPLETVRNNVIGTQVTATAAMEANAERFILVSTDKAVRPVGVMGASKRISELVIQDLQTRSDTTVFSMVRFGNVLESSGSVFPLFEKQIAERKPITVTHPDITRYFMTIPEAVNLVLLAGSYAEGGEVFVLDMGDSVKIDDLARRMIELSGLSVRCDKNPSGDIEIIYTGLRPGEKLYEELLVDSNTIGTPHPKIMRAMEGRKSQSEVSHSLDRIHGAINTDDESEIRPILKAML